MRTLPKILTAAVLGSMSSLTLAGGGLSGVESVDSQHARDTEKDWSGMVGLAALSKPEYWGSDDTEGAGLPIIIVDYKDTAYFKINRAGWWFWKADENFRVGAVLQIRPAAWDDDDDSIDDVTPPLPAGFDEPDTEAEPGINVRYKIDKFTAEAQITAGEDTNSQIDLKYNLMQTAQFVVTAKLGFELLGEDQVNYGWYGDISSLDNDSATNVTVGVTAIQTLNPKWKLLYGVQSTSLDDEIDDSPVGQDDTYTVLSFGAAYSF